MELAIPEKLRLDNAANIYPASMSKHYSSLYRMKVTLTETIDKEILAKALELVSERIPTFRCTLKRGAFWWYLKKNDTNPQLLPLKPLKNFNFKDQGGLLYRVSAEGCQIFLDVFHALADGNGAMCFLLTLAGEYIHQRYGQQISYNGLVLDPREAPSYAEVEDSFKTVFHGRKGELEKNVDAYHIHGSPIPCSSVTDLRLVMPMDKLKKVCRKYDCTLTELLTSGMLWSLQKEHRSDNMPGKRSVLKVSVPVNLRPIYNSRSMRNFSSYINLGIDVKDGYLPFEGIVKAVKEQKEHDMKLENLEPKIAANVELEEMLIVRCLPLFLKHPIIDYINLHHGDRFVSQTLSNMGKINLPLEMVPYITDIDFILGKQRGNSGAASCLGYGGNLYFHMTRKIAKDSFERNFVALMLSLGIPMDTSCEALA